MIFTIVGCGESARNWMPNGISIGSNDCEKFGKPVDYLILANIPRKFGDRLNTIKKTKAKVMVTSLNEWKQIFPNCEKIQRVTSFNKLIMKGYVQTSSTTPIMCMSMAVRMGAKTLILWGVDFLTHGSYRVGTKSGDREIEKYLRYFRACKEKGIEVYRGADGSVFDKVLPIYA